MPTVWLISLKLSNICGYILYGNTHPDICDSNVGSTVGSLPDEIAALSHASMYAEAVFC